jgi:hypothetical protein
MSKGYKTITLEATRCDTNVVFDVTFSGRDWPEAERHALAWYERKKSVCAIGEHEDMPVDHIATPALYDRLNPTCEHGLSAHSCYGPDHNCSPAEIAQGW